MNANTTKNPQPGQRTSRATCVGAIAALTVLAALPAQEQDVAKPAAPVAPSAPVAQQSQAEGAIAADTTRAALERWVDARKQASKAKSDWRVEQEALQERIDIVRRQISSLKDRIVETERSIGAADQQKTQLQADGAKIAATTGQLEAGVASLEEQVRALLIRLPEPIRQKVAPLSQQFAKKPDGAQQKQISVGARFGNVLGVLNLVQKWNTEVSVTSEVRALPDGTTAEVACIYFGLGQAFYVSPKGDAAGIGTAGPEGWTWTPRNDAKAAIQAAIDVYQSKVMATFVALPFQIQ